MKITVVGKPFMVYPDRIPGMRDDSLNKSFADTCSVGDMLWELEGCGGSGNGGPPDAYIDPPLSGQPPCFELEDTRIFIQFVCVTNPEAAFSYNS